MSSRVRNNIFCGWPPPSLPAEDDACQSEWETETKEKQRNDDTTDCVKWIKLRLITITYSCKLTLCTSQQTVADTNVFVKWAHVSRIACDGVCVCCCECPRVVTLHVSVLAPLIQPNETRFEHRSFELLLPLPLLLFSFRFIGMLGEYFSCIKLTLHRNSWTHSADSTWSMRTHHLYFVIFVVVVV